MELIGQKVKVLNTNTGEIITGTIESFNIKLDKPKNIDALGYDSIMTHINVPGNIYKFIVDGKEEQNQKK